MKSKIVIIILGTLLVVGLTGTFWSSSIARAATSVWNSCPRGEVDDPYPGNCHSYIDTNNDRICDRSQAEPQQDTTSSAVDTTIGIVADPPAVTTTMSTSPSSPAEGYKGNTSSYYFLPIFLLLALMYALTWILSKKKIMRQQLHRKIWNIVLLISTAISTVLGLFLILNTDFGTNISLPFNMLFWHVEAGIAMGIIAAFHVFWHWKYFMNVLKVASKET